MLLGARSVLILYRLTGNSSTAR